VCTEEVSCLGDFLSLYADLILIPTMQMALLLCCASVVLGAVSYGASTHVAAAIVGRFVSGFGGGTHLVNFKSPDV
jgi:hypothetical protein